MDVDPRLQPVGVGLNDFNFQPQSFVQHYPVYDSTTLQLHNPIDPNSHFVQDGGYFQSFPPDNVPPNVQARRSQEQRRPNSSHVPSNTTIPTRSMQTVNHGSPSQHQGRMPIIDPFGNGQSSAAATNQSNPRRTSNQQPSLPTPPGELHTGQTDKNFDPATFVAPHAARPLIPNPPNLKEWREKFFNIREPLALTSEQYHTYFPHIDNVYSHRSTQKYKKKPFVSHYWDCRLKGRPTGTPLNKGRKSGNGSGDEMVEKKKRKRKVRERDLCDVKIKVTEFFGRDELEALGKLGPGSEPSGTGDDQNSALAYVLDEQGRSNNSEGAGSDMPFGVLEPMKKFPEGHPGAEGKRWYLVQRVSGNENNPKDGPAGSTDLDHKHTLEESDRIKKNSVQRWLLAQEKEKKKQAKGKGASDTTSPTGKSNSGLTPVSIFHASGRAEQTLKLHSASASSAITLFSNSFCPFGQRVWIALELIGIPYQYVECTEKQLTDGTCTIPDLLEVNPDGTIPCIRHGNFGVWESNVMLEYLEDLAMGHNLFPVGNPQLKAHSRLWADHIHRKILPAFYSLLLTPRSDQGQNWNLKAGVLPLNERRAMLITTLQDAITKLVNASHRDGPYFLGDKMSYVDVAFAPWVVRLSRVLSYYRDFPRPEVGTRWQRWVGAIEQNDCVQRTVSDERGYHNVYGGVGEDSFDGTLDAKGAFAELRYAKMLVRQDGFGLGGDIWGHLRNENKS